MEPMGNNVTGKSKGPMMIAFLILVIVIGIALYFITPHENTPLVTGDQQAQPGTPTPLPEAGAGDVAAPIKDNDTSVTGEPREPVAP